jgi:homoserine dehydrogenase
MINIAVLGYGTVGSGVVEVINKNHASINKRAGQEVNIKYVLDLRDFPGDPVEKVLVHDYSVIVNDPEVKIIASIVFKSNSVIFTISSNIGSSVCECVFL